MEVKLQLFWGATIIIVLMKKSCIAKQRFLETPANYQEVLAGDDTKLICKVADKSGSCRWQKSGRPDRRHRDKYSRGAKNEILGGDDGKMMCKLTNKSDSCTWQKRGKSVRLHRKKYGWASKTETGDCTLLIKHSSVNLDDGFWKCLVSTNDYKRHDALTSAPLQLIVLVKPRNPRLEYHGTLISRTLTLTEGQEVAISCVSRYGNPPALLQFFIDGTKFSIGQTNITEVKKPKTWLAQSILTIHARGEMQGSQIQCRSFHPTSSSPAIAEFQLDIHYGPRSVMNASDSNTVVKKIEVTIMLGWSFEDFICNEFEANPSPHYRWVHYRDGITKKMKNPLSYKLSGRRLRIENVSWSDEGEYRCYAYNVINGVRWEIPSEMRFLLRVSEPPEMQRNTSMTDEDFDALIGWIGEPVYRLKWRFCSNPSPRFVAWQWGSHHIRAGESINPKYEALALESIMENKTATNCYWAMLEIRDLQKKDAGIYALLIENEKGQNLMNLRLKVRDPAEIRVIFIATLVCPLVILLTAVCIYSISRVKLRRHRNEEGCKALNTFDRTPSAMNRPKIMEPSKTHVGRSHQEGGLAVVHDDNPIDNKQGLTTSAEAPKVKRASGNLQAHNTV